MDIKKKPRIRALKSLIIYLGFVSFLGRPTSFKKAFASFAFFIKKDAFHNYPLCYLQ